MTVTSDFAPYIYAAEAAIMNFTGAEDVDPDVVDLVAGLCHQAAEEERAGNSRYFEDLLEKASTYVRVDLPEDEMEAWVAEIEYQLEEVGVL